MKDGLVALAVLLSAVATAAQEPRPVPLTSSVREVRRGEERLRGIDAVDIFIEPLQDASSRCALTRSVLQQAAKESLGRVGVRASISEKGSSWFYTLVVSVQTIGVDQRCVSSVSSELVTQVDGIPEADRYATSGAWGSLLVGPMPLLRSSTLVESKAIDHATAVQGALAAQIADIGRRITSANK